MRIILSEREMPTIEQLNKAVQRAKEQKSPFFDVVEVKVENGMVRQDIVTIHGGRQTRWINPVTGLIEGQSDPRPRVAEDKRHIKLSSRDV